MGVHDNENAAGFTARVAVDPDTVGWFPCKSDGIVLLPCGNAIMPVRGDHRMFEIASDFEFVYSKKSDLHRLGSLEGLYKTMHKVRDKNPGNIWG